MSLPICFAELASSVAAQAGGQSQIWPERLQTGFGVVIKLPHSLEIVILTQMCQGL